MSDVRGLPLLSGPPPPPTDSSRAEMACRKCNKEFNILFTRSRRCNHCSYSYCSSCSDYQALMPRNGTESGYMVMPVCAFCIEYLTITASGRGQLKTLPLAKLKKYVNAYNIRVDRAVEKDDFIDAIVSAKGQNGCLSQANEEFYRKYSVPDRSNGARPRGIFSRSSQPPPPPQPRNVPPRPQTTQPQAFPRPDLAPDDIHPRPQPRYAPPPGPPPRQPQFHAPPGPPPPNHTRPNPSVPPRPQPPSSTYPGQQYYSQHPPPPPPQPPSSSRPYQRPHGTRSSENLNVPNTQAGGTPRPRATSTAHHPTPPNLDELLQMPPQSISALSISTLKAILFTNHVNAGLILEKGELVIKVNALVEEERRGRERQRMLEEQEEEEARQRQRAMMEEHERNQREREEREKAANDAAQGEGEASGSTSTPAPSAPPLPPKAQAMAATLERTGLCVICQDEEANIAIVDCGHLAMCRACSELIMGSSRECPLCRTRIVTEARLLRIFKT